MKTRTNRGGHKLGFIGAGNMAEALIKGIVAAAMTAPENILTTDVNVERLSWLHAEYGIRTETLNVRAAEHAEVLLLCVKPQIMPRVLAEIGAVVTADQMVISIAAGVPLARLEGALAAAVPVVRAMQNTPAQIGEGMTVWTVTPNVNEKQREQARAVFQALGKEMFVDEEKFLDMATAVSGTGPTYTFLVLEALIDAAVHLGFSRDQAHDIVLETMRGSILYAEKTGKHPAELRNQVTSPGGTSAEAIYQMEKGSLRTVLSKAVWAAYQKSVLLGETVGKGEPRKPVDA